MISKIELKCFQINLMLELFMCLKLELLKLIKILYSLRVTFFFFEIFDPNLLTSFFCCLDFSLNLHFFFQQELPNSKPKNLLVGRRGV